MRHGVAFRKLSCDSQHRDMLLRNLVSSLLAHERIQTTFAKAKEAARVAEWVIGWGKSGRLADTQAARKFLLNQDVTMPKLFQVLSHRYAARQGGYTRVHKYGHRKGDHAPSAILELVDGPNDLRFNMAAKIAGREFAQLSSNGRNDNTAAASVKRWAAQSSMRSSTASDGQQQGDGSTSQAEDQQASSSMSQKRAFSSEDLPEIYKLLSSRTQESIIKALRFRQSQPLLSPSTSSSSTSSSSSPVSAFESFETLVRDSYFRASVLSKVPSWEVDPDKLEALEAASGESSRPGGGDRASTSRVPLTLPGRGRKLWAGQEGNNPHDRLLPSFSQISIEDDSRSEGITQEEHEAALAQATEEEERATSAATASAAAARIQQHKKTRHANGRNGSHQDSRSQAGTKEKQSRPSAIGRAKGQLAPSKGLKEFRVTGRAELPRVSFAHRSQHQQQQQQQQQRSAL